MLLWCLMSPDFKKGLYSAAKPQQHKSCPSQLIFIPVKMLSHPVNCLLVLVGLQTK